MISDKDSNSLSLNVKDKKVGEKNKYLSERKPIRIDPTEKPAI